MGSRIKHIYNVKVSGWGAGLNIYNVKVSGWGAGLNIYNVKVSGWGAGLMSIPVCINSSLSVLQEIMSLLLNLIKYRDSVNVISIESLL